MANLDLDFDKEPDLSVAAMIFAKRLLRIYPTLSLSALSGCSYLGAYSYQLGYFNDFQIPPNLIDIQISDFIYIGIICIVVLIFSYMVKNVTDIRKDKSMWFWELFIYNGALFFIIIAFKILIKNCPLAVVPIAVLVESIIAYRAIVKYKVHRDQKRRVKNIWNYTPAAPVDEDKFYESYRNYFGAKIGIYIFFPLFTFIFSFSLYLIGYSYGATRNEFWTIKNYPNLIIVKESKSIYICKSYNNKTHLLSDSVYLIKADLMNEAILITKILPNIPHNNIKN